MRADYGTRTTSRYRGYRRQRTAAEGITAGFGCVACVFYVAFSLLLLAALALGVYWLWGQVT